MRRCTVCDHKARMAIDLDLTGSETYRTIAGRYGLAETSLKRHRANHLKSRLVRAIARRDDKDADTLIASVLDALAKTQAILAGADDPDLKSRAIDRLHRGLELRGKVTGEIMSANVAAFLTELGISGEPELRRIVESHRALDGLTIHDAEADIVEVGRLYLGEHPERAGALRTALFGEQEVTATAEGEPSRR